MARPSTPRRLGFLLALLTGLVVAVPPLAYYTVRARQYLDLDLETTGDPLMQGDSELGFAARPSSTTVRRHPRAGLAYVVHTDGRGARVPQPGLERPRPRVLALGCSYTWGHGVAADETYVERLGARLGVDTANFAFAAYGTTQALLLLRRHAELRPAVVVYGLMPDQARRNVAACAPAYGPACLPSPRVDFDAQGRPRLEPPDLAAFAFYERFAAAFFQSASRLGPRHLWLAAEADLRQILSRRPGVGTPETRRAALVFLLREIHGTARGLGAPLVVVHLPRLERDHAHEATPAVAQALEAVAAPDVHVVDLAPLVAAHYARPDAPLLRFDHDGHPNAAAHALFADALEPLLGRLL